MADVFEILRCTDVRFGQLSFIFFLVLFLLLLLLLLSCVGISVDGRSCWGWGMMLRRGWCWCAGVRPGV